MLSEVVVGLEGGEWCCGVGARRRGAGLVRVGDNLTTLRAAPNPLQTTCMPAAELRNICQPQLPSTSTDSIRACPLVRHTHTPWLPRCW